MPAAEFHLAHHVLEGNSHGDLFLDLGEETLATYEIEENDLDAIKQLVDDIPYPHFFLISEESNPSGEVWPAHRKSDHRKKYLSYEGPVSNRGHLYSVLKGKLNFTFPLKPLPEKLWFGVHAGQEGTRP
ncbi:MAG TPA: hypothetical protein DEA96_02225 [Leptospiraceae bacterium]|nr:hypothetical protein [Spirochaetaceae bacterium]HBS03752.1 hypothetical protein [Leptospiraceae bacterium]|tara:strand:+ start:1003 stop:1389 length:387 start_codon:yes stop_codon:yes gene_type:complete